MRVLLLGSGGRESALGDVLARSPSVTDLIAAPGNPGLAALGACEDVDVADPLAVLGLARRVAPHLVVVGPEAPLVAGVPDALRAGGLRVFGPDAAAARIEGSKSYAKQLMESARIPTARGKTFDNVPDAVAFMDALGAPYVVKADGLAAGKGVVVTEDRAEAVAAVEERIVGGAFGDAGRRVVIEEFLDGEECSLIAFTDGDAVVPCEPAQDYKRVEDGDRGPNTGGMGSYSPVPSCPPALAEQITAEVVEPMVQATRDRGAPFTGAIYAGVALTSTGPKVVEFNARFGDPETQALVPRLESDAAEVMAACARRDLAGAKLEWAPDVCVSVVLSSRGYPGAHRAGIPIEGIADAEHVDGVRVFHAGTRFDDGVLVTAGGRVLAVSALAPTFAAARARAYDAASRISFAGKHQRNDIARRAEDADG